ncbi:acetoacetyl-CoA synthetase [Alkalispirillum mobile]|uniref:Acetoacetyl-CoA synthetase n=1 Tax=Alkalispirillum mobile TaxID=85925 RepID=A0A498C132_9GAMM|nr:acetoacetate--CoA ligase [Alkalispirillum mobile]RLK46800.1 acetoacetyl-CoA synthetase [Alkalispirillum mobile]
MSEQNEILWQPGEAELQQSNIAHYIDWLAAEGYGRFEDYHALHAWSIEDLERFWASIWDYTGVIASRPYDRVLGRREMPGAEWFPGARLNFAENLLRHALHGDASAEALLAVSESGAPVRLSRGELLEQVAALQGFLRAQGVGPGDRVAGVVGNTEHALIGMLAATGLGAIWSSASPDFGVSGVLDRFSQIEPKVLLAVNGYSYNGKPFPRLEQNAELAERLPGLAAVLSIPLLPDVGHPEGEPFTPWDEALAAHAGARPVFEQLPADHPVYILYSSGTTGVPKCIVHGAGGMLLNHSKELMLHADLKPGDTFFYFTTCGWMMWNWLASGLVTGARLVLFEGSPGYPNLDVCWDLAEREGITHFGTSAKFLGGCRKKGLAPGEAHDLSALRVIFSTGSPLLPEDYDWVYGEVKRNVLLASISGGTDICGCFVGGTPNLPVRRGEIQCRLLGVDAAAYDDDGQDAGRGRGELVVRQPFPAMPVQFWNDPDKRRYKGAYFDTFPGVWAHGDYVRFTERGGAVIYGRSDATLNPGGVRIGTAEIYRQVEQVPEVADSLVVGEPVDGDVRVLLLVVMAEGEPLTDELVQRIKRSIKENASPRHVPGRIVEVPDIPYTRSGKKVEIAVARMLQGREPGNRAALSNPEALDAIAARL